MSAYLSLENINMSFLIVSVGIADDLFDDQGKLGISLKGSAPGHGRHGGALNVRPLVGV